MKATIELTLRYGFYGEKSQSWCINLDERDARNVMQPLELSNEPMSLMLASPGMMGGRGDAVTIRDQTFKLRQSVARSIVERLTADLMEAFGENDELDGYKVAGMSPEERSWHESRGRLKRKG